MHGVLRGGLGVLSFQRAGLLLVILWRVLVTTSDGAVEMLAARLQCPVARIAGIPMPCPNRSHGAPVFHMHIGKTGGRTVYTFAPTLVGQANCDWNQANMSWGRPEYFVRTVRENRAELASRPCFTTYEVGWRAVDEGFGPTPPIVLTMLREPLSWLVSAIEHDKLEKRRNKGIDDVVRRGCIFDGFAGEVRPEGCLGYDYMNFVVSNFLTLKGVGRFQDAPYQGRRLTNGFPKRQWARRLETAKAHLDSSVFGLVEHFHATKCLWAFQFGHHVSPQKCDCRIRQHTPDHHDGGKGADLGGRSGSLVHIGIRKGTRETIDLRTLQSLRRVTEGPLGACYAYALSLFLERVKIMQASTSIKVLCDFD